jgi:hypothetical protein
MYDAIVTLSYSGPAYIEHVPTDQWIVRCATGVALSVAWDGSPAIMLGPNLLSTKLQLGRFLIGLSTAINLAIASTPALSQRGQWPFRIVAVGWQWDRVRRFKYRPVMYEWHKPNPYDRAQILCGSRVLGRFWDIRDSPPGYIFRGELEQLRRDGGCFRNIGQWVERVGSLMRAAAVRNKGYIGADLMLVHIPPPLSRHVYVDFLPDPGRADPVLLDGLPATFSPWVVDGWHIYPPGASGWVC